MASLNKEIAKCPRLTILGKTFPRGNKFSLRALKIKLLTLNLNPKMDLSQICGITVQVRSFKASLALMVEPLHKMNTRLKILPDLRRSLERQRLLNSSNFKRKPK
jgi:hypothetical protein